MSKKQLRRRAYLLSKVREQGVRCKTQARTIFFPYGEDPMSVTYIDRLMSEFKFIVQFEIAA